MILHEVPDDVEPLDSAPPGIVMSVVSSAVNHLLAPVTPGPHHAPSAQHSVHVSLVVGALRVAVHAGDQILHDEPIFYASGIIRNIDSQG